MKKIINQTEAESQAQIEIHDKQKVIDLVHLGEDVQGHQLIGGYMLLIFHMTVNGQL